MEKQEFLSEVKKVDRPAYVKLRRMARMAALDQKYSDRINYAYTYRFTDIPSLALVGLCRWSETAEGDDYWWGIYNKLVENYK